MKICSLSLHVCDDFNPNVARPLDVETEHDQKLVFEVQNLRLKPQQPKQKTWKLFFEVLADSDLEESHIRCFCGEVGRFALRRGEAIKVVATDFSEGHSLTTTRSEVVGQK